jgi:hypothetical protein
MFARTDELPDFDLVLEIKELSGCAWQWFQTNTMLGWMHFSMLKVVRSNIR